MKYINIIVEGSTEEAFVNDVLTKHFAQMNKFVSVRKITTGWDKLNNKPAKGGFGKVPHYQKFKNDILNWISADRNKPNTWYTTFVDLYAFPKDSQSPYTVEIQNIKNIQIKLDALENAISQTINHPKFIPYVQLHEFEALVLVDPQRLLTMFPEKQNALDKLIKEIGQIPPEQINDSPHTSPSKRLIKYIPEYAFQKAQIGPMITEEIGLYNLRLKCPHFDSWIQKLESL